MRVLVLGGSGTIGNAVVRALVASGHEVAGLARSPEAAERLLGAGAEPVAGDIAAPRLWMGAVVGEVDAVVHAACSFDSDMGAVDSLLLDALLPALADTGRRPALVYTGGCWLWGPSPDLTIDEATPFDPLPAFAWMVAGLRRVLDAPGIRPAVVHPGMVHAAGAGPIATMEAQARAGGPVRVVGSEDVLWPMVHADDLADLYRRIIEQDGFVGQVIGVADQAVPVGLLARRAAARLAGERAPAIVSEDRIAAERGDWARGYARSQRMSGDLACQRFGWAPSRTLLATADA